LIDVVVMAAGEGRRLRPVTERWPKPLLPIAGRPVLGSLLRELSSAGLTRVFLVTGHLAAQVEELVGDGSAYGVEVAYVDQPRADGSADAVRRAVEAGATPPLVVSGADKLYAPGTARDFAEAFTRAGAAAALAVEPNGRPAPLWGLTAEATARLGDLPGPPYELLAAVKGLEIAEVQIGKARDLTDPLDLVKENFPYLR
jgi:NDP-sugar pyrophosphorylase family protein